MEPTNNYHYGPDNQQNSPLGNYPDNYNYVVPDNAPNAMSTASLVLGICSILLLCCGIGFPLGALGILLAVLSRGSKKMTTNAKVGLGLSIASFVIGIVAVIYFAVVSIGVFTSVIDVMKSGEYNFETQEGIDKFTQDFVKEFLERSGEGNNPEVQKQLEEYFNSDEYRDNISSIYESSGLDSEDYLNEEYDFNEEYDSNE